MKCVAMEGLIEEANEVIESTEKNEVRDAALIAAAQKVEHYEIDQLRHASYPGRAASAIARH